MDSIVKEELTEVGINVDEAMERFMGNEALFSRMMKKFKEDPSYRQLMEACDKKDTEAAVKASHTLKGVSGNLSLKSLYELTAKQVELLRGGSAEEAFSMMPQVTETYEAIINKIDELF